MVRHSLARLAFALVLGSGIVALAQSSSDAELQTLEAATLDTGESYLVDGEGYSLYVFLNDEAVTDASTCFSECVENWPPAVATGNVDTGENLDSDAVGTITRGGGAVQVSYHGWPLYYFANDEQPGDTAGQGINEVWFLVSPEGEPLRELQAEGQEGGADEAASNSPSGVPFTQAQVERGMASYEEHCALCHQSNLRGTFEAPELAGVNFRNYWGGRTLSELYNFVSTTMPLGQGGSLDDQTYADILAYIFSENGYSGTGSELQPNSDALQNMTIPESD